jgi:signal transduction histidine kinase
MFSTPARYLKIQWLGEWVKAHRHVLIAFFAALATVVTLLALIAIVVSLHGVAENRERLYRTLSLGIGQTVVDYIRHKDQFTARQDIIIFAIGVIGVLYLAVILLLYVLAKIHQLLSATHEQLEHTFKQLEQTHQQLKEEETIKSEMISALTHNANTNLSIIDGRLTSIEMKTTGVPAVAIAGDLAVLRENAASLNWLVDNINANELIRQGQVKIHLQPVELHRTIQDVLSGFFDQWKREGTRLEYSLEGEYRVLASGELIRQVLLNLVHNATKFNRPGGLLKIATALEGGGMVRTMVQDEGPGIAPENWEAIFKPYVRLINSNRGAGLGLSISRTYIQKLNGQLGVQESQFNRGTTFYFTLPLAMKKEPKA